MQRDERDLPYSVEINGTEYAIRNNCDYRVVLDCMEALQADDLTDEGKWKCALYIFYEDVEKIKDGDIEQAMKAMVSIIDGESAESQKTVRDSAPRLMDWKHDFSLIAAAVNKVLGYDIRTPLKFTHWYSLLAAYMEIGECTFSTVVSIRSKKQKGKKLDKWELDYVRDHRERIELPKKITAEEREILNSPW